MSARPTLSVVVPLRNEEAVLPEFHRRLMKAVDATPGGCEVIYVEHWLRYTVSGWSGDLYGHSHAFPRGTIWLFAVLALLPLSVLLPVVAWRWRHLPVPATPADRSLVVYFACWALAPCVLFT